LGPFFVLQKKIQHALPAFAGRRFSVFDASPAMMGWRGNF
jgi:hypothetical protein